MSKPWSEELEDLLCIVDEMSECDIEFVERLERMCVLTDGFVPSENRMELLTEMWVTYLG